MKQKTVFLIDDDPEDLQFMRDALNRVDSSILCVSFVYPDEAIKLLTKELIVLPDYIFLDMNMPKITGEDCLRHLRITSYPVISGRPMSTIMQSMSCFFMIDKVSFPVSASKQFTSLSSINMRIDFRKF
jgi:CheY-like chemotaxis protein